VEAAGIGANQFRRRSRKTERALEPASKTATGKNFPVGAQLYVVQCVTADQSLTGGGCNIDGAQGPETVGSNGSWGPVALTLKTGQIGTDPGTCGTTKTDAKACSVSVGTASGTDSLQVPIKFTIPKTKK